MTCRLDWLSPGLRALSTSALPPLLSVHSTVADRSRLCAVRWDVRVNPECEVMIGAARKDGVGKRQPMESNRALDSEAPGPSLDARGGRKGEQAWGAREGGVGCPGPTLSYFSGMLTGRARAASGDGSKKIAPARSRPLRFDGFNTTVAPHPSLESISAEWDQITALRVPHPWSTPAVCGSVPCPT